MLDAKQPHLVEVKDLPTSGTSTKRTIDPLALCQWLGKYDIDYAYIEYVTPMQGWGTASSFRFGMAFGSLRTAVAMRGIPYELVTPVKWKKFFGLIGKDKEDARQKALQLFPKCAELFARKKDHQRADAALLAVYGMHTNSSGG